MMNFNNYLVRLLLIFTYFFTIFLVFYPSILGFTIDTIMLCFIFYWDRECKS